MKILYASFLNEDIRPGYKMKIHGQYKAFYSLGYETYLYIVKNDGMALYTYDGKERLLHEFSSGFKRKCQERNISDELKLIRIWKQTLVKVIKQIKPEVVYIRRIVPINPWLLSLLSWLKREGVKIIYEYPTFPWEIEQKKTNKLFYIIDKLLYKKLVSLVDEVTYMGTCDDRSSKLCEIQNGIDVDSFELHKSRNESDVVLIGVAHVAYYHGYDRVIKGLEEYYKTNPKRKVLFRIVGPIDQSLQLEKMVRDLQLEDVVRFYGMKTGEELNQLFDDSDIGVGSLGLFRKGFEKASCLKSREYMARGLCRIAAGELDVDLEDRPDYVFMVENNDTPINIQYILSMYDQMQTTPTEIQRCARENMSWKKEMKKALEFLYEIREI